MKSNWKKCVILGCGKLAHNHGKNIPGTYCSAHQKIRAKIEKPLVCDNHKGYLGYYCSATIVDQCQIHTDHWDGDRKNNDTETLVCVAAPPSVFAKLFVGRVALSQFIIISRARFRKNMFRNWGM